MDFERPIRFNIAILVPIIEPICYVIFFFNWIKMAAAAKAGSLLASSSAYSRIPNRATLKFVCAVVPEVQKTLMTGYTFFWFSF